MKGSQGTTNSTTNTTHASSTTSSQTANAPFKNILKKEKIRVFRTGNKYMLVDAANYAFMIFEIKHESQDAMPTSNALTIELVDFSFRYSIALFPTATRIYFNALSKADIQYMCEAYKDSSVGYNYAKNASERIEKIKLTHNVSRDFARLLSKISRDVCLYDICHDIREAHFYVHHKKDWQAILRRGYFKEKKEILAKLLPQETYDAFNLESASYTQLDTLCHEILRIS